MSDIVLYLGVIAVTCLLAAGLGWVTRTVDAHSCGEMCVAAGTSMKECSRYGCLCADGTHFHRELVVDRSGW